jgi:hypothetical protein
MFAKLCTASRDFHNFVKISGAHKMSPAQAAGVDSRLWEIEDMVAMIEAWEAANIGS